MLIIWQGYGYIALAAVLLPMAACVGLIDFSTGLGLLGAGVGFILAAVICFWSNRYLRRAAARRAAEASAGRDPGKAFRTGGSVEADPPHTLYFVPLWAWGWIYLLFGLFFTLGGIAGIIRKGWRQ